MQEYYSVTGVQEFVQDYRGILQVSSGTGVREWYNWYRSCTGI